MLPRDRNWDRKRILTSKQTNKRTERRTKKKLKAWRSTTFSHLTWLFWDIQYAIAYIARFMPNDVCTFIILFSSYRFVSLSHLFGKNVDPIYNTIFSFCLENLYWIVKVLLSDSGVGLSSFFSCHAAFIQKTMLDCNFYPIYSLKCIFRRMQMNTTKRWCCHILYLLQKLSARLQSNNEWTGIAWATWRRKKKQKEIHRQIERDKLRKVKFARIGTVEWNCPLAQLYTFIAHKI